MRERPLFPLFRYTCIVLLFFAFVPLKLTCASDDDSLNLSIKGQWFLGYQFSPDNGAGINQFTLKRGYITFEKSFSPRLSVRFTQDITLDKEGEDAGNIELRLKYCLLKYSFADYGFLQDPQIEVGLVHRPWLDFEQKFNLYRVQGKMFLERYKVINSADFGITFMALLGGEMDKRYQDQVNGAYSGLYGSVMLGVYNGPGYHAIEFNDNKTLECRCTFRPFPYALPGLQATYSGVYGKANNVAGSRFTVHDLYLSSESRYHRISGQYYWGTGDYQGRYVDSLNVSGSNKGYSLFGELRTLEQRLCFFGRYDSFLSASPRYEDIRGNSIIVGISSYFLNDSKILFDIDFFRNQGRAEYRRLYEVALEVLF